MHLATSFIFVARCIDPYSSAKFELLISGSLRWRPPLQFLPALPVQGWLQGQLYIQLLPLTQDIKVF